MRHKIIKRITAITSVALAGIITVIALHEVFLTAEAGDTLFGIQTLVQSMQEREKPYTILEIVPDMAYAEIGYYVGGNEPALSQRVKEEDGTYTWMSWQESLGQFASDHDRSVYMGELYDNLKAFYGARGIDESEAPVSYEAYGEKDKPTEGYTELTFKEQEKHGYFVENPKFEGAKYDLDFKFTGTYEDLTLKDNGEQYYYATQVRRLTISDLFALSDETPLYKMNNSFKDFTYVGTRGDVSGGDLSGGDLSGGDVSDGDAEDGTEEQEEWSDYYTLTFTVWDWDNLENPDTALEFAGNEYKALYRVLSIEANLAGRYQFIESPEYPAVKFPASTIYYRGGFVNNEWFRNQVINLDSDQMDRFDVKVITMTAEEVNAMEGLPEYDLLYLASGWQQIPELKPEVPGEGTEDTAGTEGTDAITSGRIHYSLSLNADKNGLYDLNKTMMDTLYTKTMSNEIPCIVDMALLYGPTLNQDTAGGIMFDLSQANSGNCTNIFRLAARLTQNVPSAYYQDFTTNGSEDVALPDLLAGVKTDADANFVAEQIYGFHGKLVGPDFGLKDIYDDDGSVLGAGKEIGFEPVLEEIEAENQNREVEGIDTLPLSVSQATVVRHIISYRNRQIVALKDGIRVLELGPCKSDPENPDLTEEDILLWVQGKPEQNDQNKNAQEPDEETKLEVTIERMTTAEFIGHIDDINEKYDLIYISADAPYLNINDKGMTEFNDTEMNGLVYFHVGDMRYTAMGLAGQLDTEYVDPKNRDDSMLYFYNPVRYSGNDITPEKMNALLSFMDAHYPVVVSDALVLDAEDSSATGNGEDGNRTVNEEIVDNSSYMYEFLKAALEKPNLYASGDLVADWGPSAKFLSDLNRPKVKLQDLKVTYNSIDNSTGVYELDADETGKYLLEYSFTLVNEGAASVDTRYKCQLYVDTNADGRYSVGEELGDVAITENGKTVSADALYVGKTYVLRRYVPSGYKGALPWKIQVTQLDKDSKLTAIHTSQIGYTKLKSLEREQIKILQITRNPYKNADGKEEKLFNLEYEFEENNASIYHILLYGGIYNDGTTETPYDGIYDNFDISVDTMTVSEFEEAFQEAKEADEKMLDRYNMLILGFTDGYQDISAEPLTEIKNFTESGKSVLFANDTISASNYKVDGNGMRLGMADRVTTKPNAVFKTYNPYHLTQTLRNTVGMDRYGVTSYWPISTGQPWVAGGAYWDEMLGKDKDIAYKARSGRTETYGLTHGYTYTAINGDDNGKPIFAASMTADGREFENRFRNLDYGTVYYGGGYSDNGEIAQNNPRGTVSSLLVTQVNSGQITEYPYKLSTTFEVAPTHAQTYQLDFYSDNDKDGQSDLVVWYCLGGRTNNEPTIYSMSPNDVVNNYYIYSKGNVTYTCMGTSGTSSVEEAKLFINTMIASYNAGLKDPQVAVLSDNTSSAVEITSVSRYYDEQNSMDLQEVGVDLGSEAGYEKIYFMVNDYNFIQGKREIAVNCYYGVKHDPVDPSDPESADKDPDVKSIPYDGKTTWVKELGEPIYNAKSRAVVEEDKDLASGEIYYVLVPKSLVQGAGARLSIYFESQTSITSKSIFGESEMTVSTDKAYKRFDFTKVQLFNLQ